MTFFQAAAVTNDFEWTLIKALGSAGIFSIFACIGFLVKTLTNLNTTLQDFRMDVIANYQTKTEAHEQFKELHRRVTDHIERAG